MNCGPVHTHQMVNTTHDWWVVFTMTTVPAALVLQSVDHIMFTWL